MGGFGEGACWERACWEGGGWACSARGEICDGSQQSRAFGCLFGEGGVPTGRWILLLVLTWGDCPRLV